MGYQGFTLENKHVATVEFDLITACCVIAQIQLACRHHRNSGSSRQIAESFARVLQAKVVEVAPENAAMLEMGWDPNLDVE